MAGIEITTDNEEIELSDTAIARIADFKEAISVNGICRNDVLSLEEFVGSPVITRDYKINKLTQAKTRVGIDEVMTIADKCIAEISIKDAVTDKEMLELIVTTKHKLDRVTYMVNDLTSVKPEIMDKLTNTKYINKWSDADEPAIEDITEQSVVSFMLCNKSFMNNICREGTLEDHSHITGENADSGKPLTLLSLLLSKSVYSVSSVGSLVIQSVTMKDVIGILNNTSPIIANLEDIRSSVISFKDDVIYHDETYETKYMFKMYKKLKHLNDILDDSVSKEILNIMKIVSRA